MECHSWSYCATVNSRVYEKAFRKMKRKSADKNLRNAKHEYILYKFSNRVKSKIKKSVGYFRKYMKFIIMVIERFIKERTRAS